MHEYSIAVALIEKVEVELKQHQARSVRRIMVRIGELSGVEPELLVTAFEMAREQTACEGAELTVEYVKARWVCALCAASIDPQIALRCSACGGAGRLAAGEELDLYRMELEVSDV